MSIENNQLADRVIIAFKNILSDEAKSHISDKEFHELHLIVREALSQQLSQTVEAIDDLSREIRSKIGHQDIGL